MAGSTAARLGPSQSLLKQFAGLLVLGGVGRIDNLLDAISRELPVGCQGEEQVDGDSAGGADFGNQGLLNTPRDSLGRSHSAGHCTTHLQSLPQHRLVPADARMRVH